MGCVLLSPWRTAINALVYFWHLHKWFLAGVIGGKTFTLYHRQSVLSPSTTLTNHRCLCPRLQVSASLRSQTLTCRTFTPEEKNPLTSLYRIIILGNTITVNIKVKSASWEWFRWGNPSRGAAGPPSCVLGRRRSCSHICHHWSLRRIWMIWSFIVFTLAQSFSFLFIFAEVSSRWPPPPGRLLAILPVFWSQTWGSREWIL